MDEKKLYTGPANAGPYDGKTLQGRFSGGIVFVNKEKAEALIYDWSPDNNVYYARTDFPEQLDWAKARKAMAEPNYEVRSAIEGAPW